LLTMLNKFWNLRLCLHLIICTFNLLDVQAVVSPLDKVTEELRIMKETVSTVQASLVTSVSLLQDQLSEFTKKTSGIINQKLSSLEQQVETINTNLASINSRTQEWDSEGGNMKTLNKKMTSLEDKIEDITKSQEIGKVQLVQKLKILPQVDLNIEKIDQKMTQLESQLHGVNTRLISLQDNNNKSRESDEDTFSEVMLSKLSKIESELQNVSSSGHNRRPYRRHHIRTSNQGHRRNDTVVKSMCHENREILNIIQEKMDIVWQTMKTSYKEKESMPRFEYLRSEAVYQNKEIQPGSFSDSEDRVTHLGKIAIPFKRVNKRLSEIRTEVQNGNLDIQRQLSDFKAMSSEISQERNLLLQGYAKDFASLQQCCSGHSTDFNRFVAQTGPVVERMDRWMTSWQNLASQKFDRILQQNSYDHDTIIKGQKAIEKLIFEGIDRCKNVNKGNIKHLDQEIKMEETEIITEATATVTDSQLSDEPLGKQSKGCEDTKLTTTFESKVFRVADSQKNEKGRDLNIRYCDQETGGGGWTVIQRRGDYGEQRINFTKDWKDYKHGFGDLNGEFWFGNDYISELSSQKQVMLRVELEAHDGRTAWAEYDNFKVEKESADYRLWVGGYSGNASDSLSAHNGYKFSTVDRNNDQAPKCCPCAPAYGGGWWFYSCFEANLNGEYFSASADNGYYKGIIWELWLGDMSLKSAQMMIRPSDYHVGYAPDYRDP